MRVTQITLRTEAGVRQTAGANLIPADVLRKGCLIRDTGNLEARDAKVIQLTIGELRQLLNGFPVQRVGTDLGQEVSDEHGKP